MAVATALGFWGFQEKAEAAVRWQWHTIWESAFRTLQLLTTQFPRDLGDQTLPVQLQIARFAMPVFAAWFSIGALLRRLNRPISAFTAGFARDHAIVVGESTVAVALARAFRREGRAVVAVTPKPPADAEASGLERAGARVVIGDFRQDAVLRRAAVARASLLIVPDDIGTDAVLLALAVARLCRTDRAAAAEPLTLLMGLGHRELRRLVRSQVAAAFRAAGSPVTLRLYAREQTLARSLLARYPADWGQPSGAADMHVAIVGLGYMGGEILLQLARTAVPLPPGRIIITMIDRNAEGLRDQMLANYPGLTQCAELRFVQADIAASAISADQIEAWFGAAQTASAVYVCCGDDTLNLSMAIGIRRAYARRHTVAPPLFVHQSGSPALVDGLADLHEPNFDTTRIVPFGSLDEEVDPFYLVDEEIDVLARLLHRQYLAARTPAAAPSPAAVVWEQLDEAYRVANRSQADHIETKLRTLGWHAVPQRAGASPPIEPALLELMATQEHDRWCRERWIAGWRYAAQRDDAERQHPSLVPYAQLTDDVKAFDRATVTGLAETLGNVGYSPRCDIRIGLWFCDSRNTAPPSLHDRLGEHLASIVRDGRHLHLVLPLRNAVEAEISTTLAEAGPLSLEVALPLKPGHHVPTIGPDCTRTDARRLIRAADRAYVIPLKSGVADSTDEAAVLHMAALCDKLMLVAERAEDAELLRHDLPPDLQHKIEIVTA